MSSYVFDIRDIDKTRLGLVGGKGANLGELSKIEGIRVPQGFCISTEAFKRVIEKSLDGLLDQLSPLTVDDRVKIIELSAEIRKVIEGIAIPQDLRHEILRLLSSIGEDHAYAIRSSATAEDLPTASFAGQQDSYLNVIGAEQIFRHISKCWASLFNDRAVIYRLQNGFDHRKVQLSVVVQRMVFPQSAGILFTADPITFNRKVLSIDASFGLGEAMVSGLVNPDVYKVANGMVLDKKISTKKLAVYAVNDGGTKQQQVEPERQNRQVLTEEQILELERIGRTIEAHFGCPQDIEWCLVDDSHFSGHGQTFYIVQSRPITTLFPVPVVNDQGYHVYVSVGHQQMMTDPIRPLGLSFFQLTSRAPMVNAGGRLFVDVTPMLASAESRQGLLDAMGKSDPLMKDALVTVIERGGFIGSPSDDKVEVRSSNNRKVISPSGFRTQVKDDPTIPHELIKSSQASLEELKRNIHTRSGTDLFEFILEDIDVLKKSLSDPQSMTLILAAMDASSWINEKMKEWLGETNLADTLSQSAPGNITSEMGLALLDVADVIRSYPEVIEYLSRPLAKNFLDEISRLNGGHETRNAIHAFLSKYGMRCAGEIDITKTRWSENPATLVPLILNNVRNFEHGASKRKFEQGIREASKKKYELLSRLKQLPDGGKKADETKQMIDVIRNFAGYREFPKYSMVNRYFVYKKALLKEAEQLLTTKLIQEKEDIYYLTFEELRDVIRTKKLDHSGINARKEAYKQYEKLTPPRVITSDGEIIVGKYKRESLPDDAIIGLAVSAGVIEGRARVILDMQDADFQEGDILVTAFTDPSWTPMFVSIKGLVTEVGGLMTHGAVIAREYGLPAVVGVENATKLIKDGQRIRINGTEGYVEIL